MDTGMAIRVDQHDNGNRGAVIARLMVGDTQCGMVFAEYFADRREFTIKLFSTEPKIDFYARVPVQPLVEAAGGSR